MSTLNFPSVLQVKKHFKYIEDQRLAYQNAIEDAQRRLAELDKQKENAELVEKLARDYELVTAPIVATRNSRSGRSEGHVVRELSTGELVCNCPAGVHDTPCWAVKEYKQRYDPKPHSYLYIGYGDPEYK